MVFRLFGRESSLADLRKSLEQAKAGTGGCVIIEGSSGIGKSRLLDAVVEQAGESSMKIAVSRITELDRLLPLAAISRLFDNLPELDDWVLDTMKSTPTEVVSAINSALRTWVGDEPAVLVLDDIHWADELTSLVLQHLIPMSIAKRPILWVLARRPAPDQGCAQVSVNHLLRHGARMHRLGPIGPADTAKMCTWLLGAEPSDDLLLLASRCEGNPFLLEELLTTARETGQIRTEKGTASLVTSGLPNGFTNAVEQHLQFLSPEAKWMLSIVSVLGRTFTVHEAAALAGRSASELLPTILEAISTAMLVEQGTSLEFRHALIRQALYDNLAGPVRSTLHREAARIVQQEGGSAIEVTEHHILSGQTANEKAIESLREAVEQVAPAAPNTAADMIIRMLDLLDAQDPGYIPLVARAVRLLAMAGRVNEATALAENNLHADLDSDQEAALLLGLSETLYVAGRSGSVVEYTTRALDQLSVSEVVRAELFAIRAWALLDRNEPDEADLSATQAIEHSENADAARCCGTAARAVVSRWRGHLDNALVQGRQAVRIAESVGGEAKHRHARLWLTQTLTVADLFGEADSMCTRGAREAAQSGAHWSQPYYQLCRAELRMAAGRIDTARAEAEVGLRMAERSNTETAAVLLLALLGRLSLHVEDFDRAADFLRRAEQFPAIEDWAHFDRLNWARAELYLVRGQADIAFTMLGDVYAALPDRRFLLIHEPDTVSLMVLIALRTGHTTEAERVVRVAVEHAEQNPGSHSLVGAAAHGQWLLGEDISDLRRAVCVLRKSPRLLLRAAALEDLARAENSPERQEHAARLMSEAGELYRCSGARRDYARTCSWSPSPPNDRAPQAAAGRPMSGWTDLTHSELRVVDLVVQGMTNREVASRLYLSPHTVDSHLRHSFVKLDVTSRVELTRKMLASDGNG